MVLKINQVSGSFHIVRAENRKFILDNRTVVSKLYFWGFIREKIIVDIIEIDKNDTRFDVKSSSVPNSLIVLGVQPFVNIIYHNLKRLFTNSNLFHLLFLKCVMFVISLLVSYLIYRFIFNRENKKFNAMISQQARRYRLTFKTDGKKNYGLGIFFLFLSLIATIIYFIFEESALVIVGVCSFATYAFSWNMLPIGIAYNFHNRIVLESMEELPISE